MQRDYSGSYSSVGSFSSYHCIVPTDPNTIGAGDLEEIAEIVGDEYKVLYIGELKQGLRNEIYRLLNMSILVSHEEDILVIKNDRCDDVRDLIMQSLVARCQW